VTAASYDEWLAAGETAGGRRVGPVTPANPGAERALLGAVLRDPAGCAGTLQRVPVSAYHDDRHRAIGAAMRSRLDRDEPVDLELLFDELRRNGTLDAAGGVIYVAGLADELPDPANVEHYAGVVLRHARERDAHAIGLRLLALDGTNGDATIAAAAAELQAVAAASSGGAVAREDEVLREVQRLKVRAEAQRRIAAQLSPPEPYDAGLLRDLSEDPVRALIDEVLHREGRMTVVAPRKSGKTTLVLNLVRCLTTGEPFLGRYRIAEPVHRVGFLNFEMSKRQILRWAREHGIPEDKFFIVNLRGRPNPFANPEARRALADLLRENHVEVLVVDTFARAFPGENPNDTGEVARWLSDLDRFAGEAGVTEIILTVHSGWVGERSRGSSALEDWPDTIAQIVRDPSNENVRFFKATGRDVEIEEDRLVFDPTTRRLTLAGAGSRAAVRARTRLDELVDAVVEAVTREPGATVGRLTVLMREAGVGLQRGEAGKAARAAAEAGKIVCKAGPRRSLQHFLNPQEGEWSRVIPDGPAGTYALVPTPLIEGGTSAVLVEGRVVPDASTSDRPAAVKVSL